MSEPPFLTIPPRMNKTAFNPIVNYLNDRAAGFEKGVSYIIRKNGSVYEVINGSTGKIDYSGANFQTLFTSSLGSNRTIFFVAGTYECPSKGAMTIYDIHDLTLISTDGATFLYTYDGATDGGNAILHIGRSSYNINVIGLKLNMQWSVLENNTTSIGISWALKIDSEVGWDYTHDIFLDKIQLLDCPDCGLVVAAARNIHFSDTIFKRFGEHAFYICGDESLPDPYNYNVTFVNGKFYNWGKYVRGYLKMEMTKGALFDHCWLEPNEDGEDCLIPSPLAPIDYGMYGFVFWNDFNVVVCNKTTLVGTNSTSAEYAFGTSVDLLYYSDNITFRDFIIKDWRYISTQNSCTNTSYEDVLLIDVVPPFGGERGPHFVDNVTLRVEGVDSKYTLDEVTPMFYDFDGAVNDGENVADYPVACTFANGSVDSNLLELHCGNGASGMYNVLLTSEKAVRVMPAVGKQVWYEGTWQTADEFAISDVEGSTMTFVADGNGNVLVLQKSGTWSMSS